MQAAQPSISGTRDYAGDDAVALQTARDAIEVTLRRYAYAAIDPPILESSSPFLSRSGEDLRRHMYIFPDPGGMEVCLRPELTIPVCRAYLRQLQSSEAAGQDPQAQEARLCYFGPAFTYESSTKSHYRQFYQAGAEFIGAQQGEAADAEILAVALDALEAAGIKQTEIQIGDVEIRNAFIDQLPISDRSKARIRRTVLRSPQETGSAAMAAAAMEAGGGQSAEFGELASLLASVDPAKADLLIREVFALADVRHVGGRTAEEIVERLISRSAQQAAEPISAELVDGVRQLFNIRGKPEAAFKAIRDHFRAFKIGSIEPVLERCDTRLRYFNAYRANPVVVQVNVGLRRGLEYYTGFLFEIYAKGLTQIGHICGGGRYDNLLEGLGANAPIPAVGFGIGLDRLLQALQHLPAASAGEMPAPNALVVDAGNSAYEECIHTSVALRAAGWSAELESSGRDERSALNYAAARKIPYVVFVGGEKSKNGEVRVRRLRDRTDRSVAINALAAYTQGESANVPSGNKR